MDANERGSRKVGMHSAASRLRRAQRDLDRAEENYERVRQYEPGRFTSREDIYAMFAKAEDRVMRLRARVRVREAAAERQIAT